MIQMRTLGVLDLRNHEGSEVRGVLSQPRRLALLVYLGVAIPHGFHRRDKILSLFWSERDTEHARASLNRAVYFLRRELGEGIVLSRGDEEIGLDHGRFWSDAAALEQSLERRDYRNAVDLYRGDLLPGFFVSGAAGFEEWLESQRARLRECASEAAWTLAEEEEAAGNFAPAAHWARRGVELAPFHETAFRRFLELLDRTGDRAGAAHAYGKFAAELAQELDVAPSPETRALIEAIRVRGRSPLPSPVSLPRPEASVSQAPPSDASRRSARRRGTRGFWWVAAAAALVLGTVGVTLMSAKAGPVDPLRVDVTPLENRTGDRSLDRLGLLAADRMVKAISQAGLAKDVRLLASASSGSRAGTVVTGAMDRAGGTVRLRLWIIDVQRGGRVWDVAPLGGTPASMEPVIDRIRPRVLGAVAVLRNPSLATLLPVASQPPAFEAYQEFLEGMKLQAQGRISEALQHYRWAAAIDTSFTWPLVHAGLASLHWFRADLTPQVDSFVHSLSLVRDRLTPLQSHLVDYMVAVRMEDWLASYRAIRAAAELAPQHYSRMLAYKANEQNRPREAVEVLTRPGLDSIHRNDIQGYWNVLTYSLHLLGEHRTELEQARRARHHQPQSALALFGEVRALAALGRMPAVQARLDTLPSLAREGWFTPGRALAMVATELRAHGHSEAASEAFQRALTWYRARPAEERASQEWRELVGEVLYLSGNWREADTAFQSLTREYPTSHGYPDNVAYLGRIGTIAARTGDRTLAKLMAGKLEEMDRAQPHPGQEAIVFRAKITALSGERDHAMRLLFDAYGAVGTTELHDDIDFETMKSYPPFQEFLRAKG